MNFEYQPETWRSDPTRASAPTPREQSHLLELLGRINYKIVQGKRVYVEVDGVVYKTLSTKIEIVILSDSEGSRGLVVPIE